MPYSALSLVAFWVTSKRSTQSRKIPIASKPFTVKPLTLARARRLASSSRQVGGATSGGAIAIPNAWPPGFSSTTGRCFLAAPTSFRFALFTDTAQVALGFMGQGVPAS